MVFLFQNMIPAGGKEMDAFKKERDMRLKEFLDRAKALRKEKETKQKVSYQFLFKLYIIMYCLTNAI